MEKEYNLHDLFEAVKERTIDGYCNLIASNSYSDEPQDEERKE